jgi:acetate kinase
MNILVCNVGSTSLKYQLIEMEDESVRAQGKMERVGTERASWAHRDGRGTELRQELALRDHGEGIKRMLSALIGPVVPSLESISCVAFKVVLAKGVTGVQFLTEDVLAAMEAMNAVAPAHNPPYIAAVRQFRSIAPSLPLIGSFETGFHRDIPPRAYLYPIPKAYAARGVRRYGYHGASHEYVSGRVRELTGSSSLKLVSCHLGGSGSLCAIVDGRSIDTTLGFSLQCGIMHNNRCGDIDPYIPIYLQESEGMSLEEVKALLTKRSGLLGLSGVSNDMRDIESAAAAGNVDARECIDAYAYYIRKQIGAYAAAMGGLDAVAFAGGIGENSAQVRALSLEGLSFLGIRLDPARNEAARGASGDALISSDDSRVRVFVVATNEEIVVARKARERLESARG